jgi:protein-S-isoprenylcysteine O-methyltransferase Ste14
MWDLKRMRSSLRSRWARPLADKEILTQSKVARAGEKLIRAAVFLRIVEPMLMLAVLFLVMTCPVLAQAPGGSIFGGSDQTVGNGVREAIRWSRNILFLIGIGAVAWGTVNIFLEKPYARQFIGGGASMAFGGIASLAYSFARGQAVDVDTDVGQ